MESSNKFGLYPSKWINVKKEKINQNNYAFLLLRSEIDDLQLLTKLLRTTHYVLKKSFPEMELSHLGNLISFSVYVDNETLEDNFLCMIKNQAIDNMSYQLIGYDNQAIFKIQKKKKNRQLPQLSLLLEDDAKDISIEDKCIDEQKRWEDIKSLLKEQSILFEKKIDYVIPINIMTCDVFCPFLMKLKQVSEIKLRLVEASDIENFEGIFYYLQQYADIVYKTSYKDKNEMLDHLLDINDREK